ncbi:SRPBCC family protein [Cellulomonas rhizosphaerae]|uniref:ATPase n=1 Tax=Cellulomonas rhizosphaerae TaxID=2293719 RepID=A0A413RQN7_9CELL|nr:hypothetical protein [Cellulomonas rhizosphaerae]RHA44228.1 hypothetical protein D1825_02330 [Cellulomonas rhizosphaerae]
MSSDLEPIRHELVLPGVTPANAFAAYVDLGSWWPAQYTPDAAGFRDARIEPWPGGRVLFLVDPLGEVEWGCVVEAVDGTGASAADPAAPAVARLVHTSTLAQPPGTSSVITVEFVEPLDTLGSTLVRFAHGGWHEGDEQLRAKFGDWPLILARYSARALEG